MATYDKFGSIRIPMTFFDDHRERDLDTPIIERMTAKHYWIDPADPSLPELVNDAEHYATDVDGCGAGLVLAARALLVALKED